MDALLARQTQEDTIVDTPKTDNTTQPIIGVKEEMNLMEEDMVDDEKDLLEDDLQQI